MEQDNTEFVYLTALASEAETKQKRWEINSVFAGLGTLISFAGIMYEVFHPGRMTAFIENSFSINIPQKMPLLALIGTFAGSLTSAVICSKKIQTLCDAKNNFLSIFNDVTKDAANQQDLLFGKNNPT